MIGLGDDPLHPPLAQPLWFAPDAGPLIPTRELTERCERLIAEYSGLEPLNRDLATTIERQRKEKLLLCHPEFIELEFAKLSLAAATFTQAIRDVEIRSARILELMDQAGSED
jgi:hypothetical protein